MRDIRAFVLSRLFMHARTIRHSFQNSHILCILFLHLNYHIIPGKKILVTISYKFTPHCPQRLFNDTHSSSHSQSYLFVYTFSCILFSPFRVSYFFIFFSSQSAKFRPRATLFSRFNIFLASISQSVPISSV